MTVGILFMRRFKILIGCAVILGLCLLVGASVTLISRWHQARTAAWLEPSVRATFPDFCTGPEDKIIVQSSTMPPSLVLPFFDRYWDVRCEPGSWMTGPAMIVDIQTCSVLPPQYGIPAWKTSYGSMIGEGQKLVDCP